MIMLVMNPQKPVFVSFNHHLDRSQYFKSLKKASVFWDHLLLQILWGTVMSREETAFFFAVPKTVVAM